MAIRDHVAYVPYADLISHWQERGGWTCVWCGGRVTCREFGHAPHPNVPLFECETCGRRSDGCQTFEGHHLLYAYCPLEDAGKMRCGHWLCEWEKARGRCPVCAREA